MNFKEFLDQEATIDGVLSLAEDAKFDPNYAIKVLSNLEKVSAYLLNSKLTKHDDLVRFKMFIAMVAKEMPKLEKAADAIDEKLPKVPAIDLITNAKFDRMWAEH